MATEVAAAAQVVAAVVAAGARGKATKMKIMEAAGDYTAEIYRMEEMKSAREQIAGDEISRAKGMGITGLTELAAGTNYDTRMAGMKAEQSVSSGEAAIGASGIRASGTVLAAQQQEVDIAYAAAERVEESGAAKVKVGGLQIANQLRGGEEQKSLLTLEYQQKLAQQKRKLKDLIHAAPSIIGWAVAGGLANVASSFYNAAESGVFDRK